MENKTKQLALEVVILVTVPLALFAMPACLVSIADSQSPMRCQKGLTDGATEAAAKITGDYI